MDLNKHIVTNDNNKPFHSNGFAQIASGNRVGSTGNVSFNQRQQIDQNRRIIYGYSRSVIGSTYSTLRAKPVLNNGIRPVVTNPSLQQHNSTPSVPSTPSVAKTPQHFTEPIDRTYNPFA